MHIRNNGGGAPLSRLPLSTAGAAQQLSVLEGMNLGLTRDDIESLAEARRTDLAEYGRIEFGRPVLIGIAEAFAASPYLDRNDCAEQLADIQSAFYTLRADTPSSIPDEELIEGMRIAFNRTYGGDLEALGSMNTQDVLAQLERTLEADGGYEPETNAEELYSITDNAGRVYVWDPEEWHDDVLAPGWAGERWDDKF